MLNLFFLILGFIPLVYGANFLVDGASSIAKRYNIPNIVIGLTIVAFGTSAPELVVNVFASISGSPDITLGNIVGSNIFNVLAILGVSAIIFPLTVQTGTTWIEIPLSLMAALVLFLIANDAMIDNEGSSLITRIDGMVLLFFFSIFMAYNYTAMKTGGADDTIAVRELSGIKSVLFVLLGFALLILGGKVIVTYGVRFAQVMNIPERIIGLTIVSIGTSLPELATSAVAAWKKNADIAIGNVVGSNIFNIFFVMGISAIIHPVPVSRGSNMDLMVNIFAGLLLFMFMFIGKKKILERWQAVAFIAGYAAYTTALIIIG